MPKRTDIKKVLVILFDKFILNIEEWKKNA